MVALHGRDLFYESVPNRMLCCEIRKSRPLARRLERAAGLFHRLAPGAGEIARCRSKSSTAPAPSVKISPLADWTTEDVMRYTREHELPEHRALRRRLHQHRLRSLHARRRRRARMNAPAAGGGNRPKPSRNAACTSAPMATPSAPSTCCCVTFWRKGSDSMTHQGFTLWLTGMSGAGKSTLSERLMARLREGRREGGVARWRYRPHQSFAGAWLQPRRSRYQYPAHRFCELNCFRATA